MPFLACTPEPPYYAVVFSSVRNASDSAGYAVVTVNGAQVEAAVHAGAQAEAFQTLKISV